MDAEEDKPTEVEESTTIDQEDDDEPVVKKIIKTSKTVAKDYERMIKILLKQTGLKSKDIEDMSPKEAFDKLSFLAEHGSASKSKNQKIIPESPSGISTTKLEGITIQDNPMTGKKSYVLDPKKIFQLK